MNAAPVAPTLPRRRHNVRGARSREAIFRAAAKCFAEHGYRGTSTAAIASAAGISEPGLLHHYGSKSGLLKALLELRYSFDGSKFHAGEALDGLSLFPLLASLVSENLRQRDQIKLTMVLLAEGIRRSHPAHAYYRNRYARARSILKEHLDRARRAGLVRRDVDTLALAATLLATMDGLQLQWLLDPEIDMAKCFASFARILAGAVGPA